MYTKNNNRVFGREELKMDNEKIEKMKDLIERIEITKENQKDIKIVKQLMKQEEYEEVLQMLQELNAKGKLILINEEEDDDDSEFIANTEEDEKIYPDELSNEDLEETYMSLLIANPKAISMFYILFSDCYFEDDELLNLYKSVLFTEGEAYAPQIAKDGYNFAKENAETYNQKKILKEKGKEETRSFEKVYVELLKLFEIRKNYLKNPIQETKDRIVDILKYELYDQMTIQEVKNAIEQITVTQKFKRGVLCNNTTKFLINGDSNLSNGLELPFPILSSVFKGVRKGETFAFAMPSNAGKSRFTIDLAAYIAFIHKKKVLIISNEMSEDKMRLCLITTVLNNKKIQELHGQDISKTESELLDFKFRPDDKKKVKIDEDGYVLKEEKETQSQLAKRLAGVSTEFNKTIKVTDWLEKQIKNSIYFVNITDHTNDELEKVILNYYYKEKIEYVFYDTLKTDTANIGNGEEVKKTATILSNLAQNLNIFIGSSLQLTENATMPINLSINDLSASRTVKEVLDTLCLIKQIHREDLDKYEYSMEEVDTKFYDLEKFKDPDVRYYACVVDKNRAGSKPKVLFRLNLAYNMWEELGYLRLKSNIEE